MNGLPQLTLDEVISYLSDNRHLKSVSLVSQKLQTAVQSLLWRRPRFKAPVTVEILETLLHLPIRRLETWQLLGTLRDEGLRKFAQLFCKMGRLKELIAEKRGYMFMRRPYAGHVNSLNSLEIIAPFLTSLNLNVFHITLYNSPGLTSTFVDRLCEISLPTLQNMKITGEYCLTLDQLKKLGERFPVTDLWESCLEFNDSEYSESIQQIPQLLPTLKHISLDRFLPWYKIDKLKGLPVTKVYLLNWCNEANDSEDYKWFDKKSDALLGLNTIQHVYLCGTDIRLAKTFPQGAKLLLYLDEFPNVEVSSQSLKLTSDLNAKLIFIVLSSLKNLRKFHVFQNGWYDVEGRIEPYRLRYIPDVPVNYYFEE